LRRGDRCGDGGGGSRQVAVVMLRRRIGRVLAGGRDGDDLEIIGQRPQRRDMRDRREALDAGPNNAHANSARRHANPLSV
jgi:hypothetical protein